MFNKAAKILLIVGIFFLIDPLLQVLNLYDWDGFLGMLFIGWLLTILGAVFISQRVSAWTFFLMGFYLMFISFKFMEGIERFLTPAVEIIIALHILLGLILGIISFQKSKKARSTIHNKNRLPV